MLLDQMHPEDVKAAIRKRFGTIGNFIREKELPTTGVADLFRGRSSHRVREAVEEVLQQDQEQANSISLDDSAAETEAHRLSGAAH
jgi:hypothetical protein